jgi:hypothetical protein
VDADDPFRSRRRQGYISSHYILPIMSLGLIQHEIIMGTPFTAWAMSFDAAKTDRYLHFEPNSSRCDMTPIYTAATKRIRDIAAIQKVYTTKPGKSCGCASIRSDVLWYTDCSSSPDIHMCPAPGEFWVSRDRRQA